MTNKHDRDPFDYDNDLEPAANIIEAIFWVMVFGGLVGLLIWWGMQP